MEEIIYKIDNWTILKLIGGTSCIILIVLKVFSKYFLSTIENWTQHKFNKSLEDIKGEISKSNLLVNGVIQNHISTTQKVFEKRHNAIDYVWSDLLMIKEKFPAGISTFCSLVSDSEILKENSFEYFNTHLTMGATYRSYDENQDVKFVIENYYENLKHKPYLSDKLFKLHYTYKALVGRMTLEFIRNYRFKKIYYWKNDEHTLELMSVVLTKDEINFTLESKFGSYSIVLEMIEHKILNEIKKSLLIEETQEDTIYYVTQMAKLVNESYK